MVRERGSALKNRYPEGFLILKQICWKMFFTDYELYGKTAYSHYSTPKQESKNHL
jgi:hypothetical protein